MRLRDRRFFLGVLVGILLWTSCPELWGWSFHTHRKLCSDAISRMPAEFQGRFSRYKDVMMKGSTDPDTLIKDFHCHVFHVKGRLRDSEERVQDLFDKAVSQLKRGDPDEDTAYTMGLLSHYVGDLNQPLHTAGSERDDTEDEYHAKFEKDVQGGLSRITIRQVRYLPVADPVSRLREMAEQAFRGYDRIGAAYRGGNKIFDLQDLVEDQYNAALGNIIDYWLGILQQAGLKPDISASPAVSMSVQNADEGPLTRPRAGNSGSTRGWSDPVGHGRNSTVGSIVGGGKVDLNTASEDQLMAIPGIGEKRARAIIAARPFKSIYDLSKLKGFGVKFIERISGYISIGN